MDEEQKKKVFTYFSQKYFFIIKMTSETSAPKAQDNMAKSQLSL
jgi:hypothetical protein